MHSPSNKEKGKKHNRLIYKINSLSIESGTLSGNLR